jgi:hypothetical protein
MSKSPIWSCGQFDFHQITLCHVPEDKYLHNHICENVENLQKERLLSPQLKDRVRYNVLPDQNYRTT